MTISGAPKPMLLYPRMKYGPITIDIPEAVMASQPMVGGGRAERLSPAGHAVYRAGAIEDLLTLELLCEPEHWQQLRWLFEDHASYGAQFQFWLDRHLGSTWLFQSSLKDQNGLALTLSQGVETYVDYDAAALPNVKGLQLTGSQYLSVPLAQASASPATGFDDPLLHTEGVLVVDFKPAFAGNDGVAHRLLDTTAAPNQLLIDKDTFNSLVFAVYDSTGTGKQVAGAVSWSANARVQIVASWTSAGALKLYYATAGGAFTELTSASGGGTGILSALPSTLYVGANNAGVQLANGSYARALFVKRAFTNPHLTLADSKPFERNYFPRAEWTVPAFQAARFILEKQVWAYPLALRLGGVAA